MISEKKYIKVYHNVDNWPEENKKELFKNMEHFIPDYDRLSSNQLKILKNVADTFKEVSAFLEPIKKYIPVFNITIAGGVIRDIILDKKPGDIDIVLSLNLNDSFIKGKDFIEVTPNNKTLYKQNIPYITMFNSNVDNNKIIHKNDLMAFINNELLKNTNDKFLFFANDNNIGIVETYQNKQIMGMVKMHKSSGLPWDIVFTNEPAYSFISTYSFDICHGFIRYEDLKDFTVKEMLDNIFLSPHMINDLKAKTLTANISNITLENLEYYLNKHYVKMKKKFPEYSLNSRFIQTVKLKEGQMQLMQEIIAMKQKEDFLQNLEPMDKMKNKLKI